MQQLALLITDTDVLISKGDDLLLISLQVFDILLWYL